MLSFSSMLDNLAFQLWIEAIDYCKKIMIQNRETWMEAVQRENK